MPRNASLQCLLNLSLTSIAIVQAIVGFQFAPQPVRPNRPISPHFVTARPQYFLAGAASLNAKLACETSGNKRCYRPQEILKAYSISSLHATGITGQGSTIAIVDAFQSPTLTHDLHLFDQMFGLPDSPLKIMSPDGLTPFNIHDAGQMSAPPRGGRRGRRGSGGLGLRDRDRAGSPRARARRP